MPAVRNWLPVADPAGGRFAEPRPSPSKPLTDFGVAQTALLHRLEELHSHDLGEREWCSQVRAHPLVSTRCATRGSGGQLAAERGVRHLGGAEPQHRVARWPGAGRASDRDTPHRAEPEPDALVTRADRLVQNVKVRPAGLYTYGS